MLHSWNQFVSFLIGFFNLVIRVYFLSISFHGLIHFFFLELNNNSIVWVYHSLLIHSSIWKTSWLLSSFGNYEQSCYKHLCASFFMELFSTPLVRTKEHYSWIEKIMFSFVINSQGLSCTILQSSQQWTTVPDAARPLQHLVSSADSGHCYSCVGRTTLFPFLTLGIST